MARTRHYAGQGDTSLRHTAGFLVASSLAGLGSLHAQTATCSPAAVTADPSPVDTAYPPVMRAVLIPSAGVHLNGVVYVAQGRGAHATVVFLHGFPGAETNADLAQAVRDRKSTRLNSSHSQISYAVFCLKKKNQHHSAPR